MSERWSFPVVFPIKKKEEMGTDHRGDRGRGEQLLKLWAIGEKDGSSKKMAQESDLKSVDADAGTGRRGEKKSEAQKRGTLRWKEIMKKRERISKTGGFVPRIAVI